MPGTHLTVAAVIERHGRFLMVEERVGGHEVVNQPAGHVEPHESLLAAVVRETLEETAWEFAPAAISGIYLWQHPESAERFLRVTYAGTCTKHHNDRALDEGILRTLWLTRAELVERGASLRSPMVLRAIDDYLAGLRYPVEMFQHVAFDELAAKAARVV